MIQVPCNEFVNAARRCNDKLLCERCQHILALRALLTECLPSLENHANKRRKGVEKIRDRGGHHDLAERRLSYLDSLMSRARAEIGQPQGDSTEFFLVPRETMNRIYNTLSDYSNEATYIAPRIGGVLRGCPRGEAPKPSQLTLGATLMLHIINRDLLGRK